MLRRKIRISILFLSCVCIFFSACGKCGSDAANLIPENAPAAVVIPNVGATAGHIGDFANWLEKQAPFLAIIKAQAFATAGGDFTKAETLTAKGINPNGSAAAAILDPQGNKAVVLVPVKDEKAFVAFLGDVVFKGAEIKKQDKYYALPAGGIMGFKKGYAIISESTDIVNSIVGGKFKPLTRNPDYKRISKALGSSGDFVFYVSKKMLETAPSPEAKEVTRLAKDIGAFGGVLNLNAKEISAKLYVSISDMGNIKKMMSGPTEGSLFDSLPGPAPVLIRTNLNVPEVWNYIKSTLIVSDQDAKKQYEESTMAMKTSMNMDLEKDIIGNIAGSPSVVFYGMVGRRKDMPDIVVTVILKDEAKVRDAIAKMAQMSSRKKTPKDLQAMGVTTFSDAGGDYYFAVARKNLVITSTPDRMKQVLGTLSGAAAAQTAIGTVKQEEAKKLLKDKKSNVAYFSLFEMVNSYRASAPREARVELDNYMKQAAGLANTYLIMTYSAEENGVVGSLSLRFGE